MTQLPLSRDRLPVRRLLTAVLAGISAVAGSFAAAGFTPSFVVVPIERQISLLMPPIVIRYSITLLGSVGQQINVVTSAIGTALLFALLAGLSLWLGERSLDQRFSVVLAGGLSWALATLLTGEPVLALAAGVPVAAVLAIGAFSMDGSAADSAAESDVSDRRRLVTQVGGVLGLSALSYVLSGQQSAKNRDVGAGASQGSVTTPSNAKDYGQEEVEAGSANETDAAEESTPSQSEVQKLITEADDKSLGVDGIEPLVSEKFFRVAFSAANPDVDESEWSVKVTGAVEEEVEIDYEQLRSMESRDEFMTLRCVGDSLNGHKMDNALWTGTPIKPIVDQANPQSGCECVMLRAQDGFFEEFPMEALEGGLIAYEMNGAPLPRKHGYPARALIPGHWGEINVKWLTEIEVLDRKKKGFWEKRGWHGTGPVKTVAKLHAVNHRDDGTIEVGGHAYAGTRGISKVEVSTDGGETWTDATLSEKLPGEAVWRQWRYAYEPGDTNSHEVVVRATDEAGNLQTKSETGPFPNGPSGWVSERVRPS